MLDINGLICLVCSTVILNENRLLKHFREKHLPYRKIRNECVDCFRLEDIEEMNKHILKSHVKRTYPCNFCSRKYATEIELKIHQNKHHNIQSGGAQIEFSEVASAFRRRIVTFRADFQENEFSTLIAAFQLAKANLKKTILSYLRDKRLMRFCLVFHANYIQYDSEGDVKDRIVLPLTSRSKILMLGEARYNVIRYLKQQFSEIEKNSESFVAAGSGWVLEYVTSIGLEIGKVQFVGGCRGAIINGGQSEVRGTIDASNTTDSECFFYAVAVGKASAEVRNGSLEHLKIWSQLYIEKYMDTKKIKRPVSVHDIKKFENRNKHLFLAVNAFCYQPGGNSFPVYRSSRSKSKKTINKIINILLIPLCIDKQVKYHYVYINDLNGLFKSEKNGWRSNICENCTQDFRTPGGLLTHQALCFKNAFQKVHIPKEGSVVTFKNYKKTMLQPITGFLDFEAILKPVDTSECQLCKKIKTKTRCKHKTTILSEHVPSTYALIFVDYNGKILFSETKTSDTIMLDFYETLFSLEKPLLDMCQRNRYNLIITPEQELSFQEATKCSLCNGFFNPYELIHTKVKHHDHYSGLYLSPMHHSCNIRLVAQTCISIYCHNLVSYDQMFLISGLKDFKKHKISGIPFNYEKFKMLKIGSFQFLDSMQLMSGSLDNLVKDLVVSGHEFKMLDQFLGEPVKPEEKKLLLSKGIYCYEFFTSLEALKNQKCLPPIEAFYSKLKGCGISESDYQLAQQVFKTFQCADMLDYLSFYCILDTILLMEATFSFRFTMFEEFNLDCTHYITLPSLAFDCMLKTVGKPIELCWDSDMILMFENGIRGGVSFVAKRHAALTAEELEENEDECKHNLLYLDCVNLYSTSQSAYMPIGDYKWLDPEEFKDTDWMKLEHEERTHGMVLELDLFYPSSLHLLHDDLPLAPDRKIVTSTDMSPYSKSCIELFKGKNKVCKYATEKLCSTLEDKVKYICHYRTLAFYLRHGMVLGKIHRIIGFRQEPFIRPFIEHMTHKRKTAPTKNKATTFKNAMNSVYGSTLMNKRKHFTVKFATTPKMCDKYMAHACYKSHKVLGENLVAIYLNKKYVRLDSLFAVGYSILELSKLHMYEIWYDFMLPVLGRENLNLILTDTDSFFVEVNNIPRKEIWKRLAPIMDFSNYPKNSPLYSDERRCIPGYMKNETPQEVINEVVGLKSKSYIFSVKGGRVNPVCKGIARATKRSYTVAMYRDCIENKKEICSKMVCFRAINHKITTREINKLGLSSSDDKRFILDCARHTVAMGNECIQKNFTPEGVTSSAYCERCKM